MNQLRADLAADRRGLFLLRVAGWPASIDAIAARARVHPSTVRAWTNRRARSKPETIRRIHAAILAIARTR
jgi:hypothetical protein